MSQRDKVKRKQRKRQVISESISSHSKRCELIAIYSKLHFHKLDQKPFTSSVTKNQQNSADNSGEEVGASKDARWC